MFKLPFYIDWEQALSFWVACLAPIFGLSWYVGCCCSESSDEPCTSCDPGTTPEDWQVEFADVANITPTSKCLSKGDCTDFNTTTYICTLPTSGGSCTWILGDVTAGFPDVNVVDTCCEATPCTDSDYRICNLILRIGFDTDPVQFIVQGCDSGGGTDEARATIAGASGEVVDCSVTRVIDMTDEGGVNQLCDWESNPATATLTPIAAD